MVYDKRRGVGDSGDLNTKKPPTDWRNEVRAVATDRAGRGGKAIAACTKEAESAAPFDAAHPWPPHEAAFLCPEPPAVVRVDLRKLQELRTALPSSETKLRLDLDHLIARAELTRRRKRPEPRHISAVVEDYLAALREGGRA